MDVEQRQVAADLWTKPTDLSHKPDCRQLRHYIHHRHLLLLSPKADTHFTIARSLEEEESTFGKLADIQTCSRMLTLDCR